MKPLDLRAARPRAPREKLAGMVFTARVIDKIRASLPGGNLNGYFTDIGLSVAWGRYSGVSLEDLRGVVESAETEKEVEQWISDQTASLDKERFNAKMQSLETARVPPHWREAFEGAYPAELRERHAFLFDLVEADDARAVR